MKKYIITVIIFIYCFSPAYAMNDRQLEVNKQLVSEFYYQVVNNKNYEAAARLTGPNFIYHLPDPNNSMLKIGAQPLKNLVDFLKANHSARSKILHIFAEESFVILQTTNEIKSFGIVQPYGSGLSLELFRLENNKIVEYWLSSLTTSIAWDNHDI